MKIAQTVILSYDQFNIKTIENELIENSLAEFV
jgi:hypothetical protein